MNTQDIISSSVIVLYIIPISLYYISGNIIHLKAFIGTAATPFISEFIKLFIIKDKSPRPIGARNCNVLCNDGNQSGQPGMPSSHSAQVAFFTGFYYQNTNNITLRICLIIYSGLVMVSRYIKRCHTINQIVTGAFLGVCLSWLTVRHL
jgi:acid phosphatase family membrane protein YuiD